MISLRRLWTAARRRDGSAQLRLHALVQEHPSLSVVFRSYAQQRDRQKLASEKAAGIKRNKKREYVSWVRAGREGPPNVTIVAAGLPSLGKRR